MKDEMDFLLRNQIWELKEEYDGSKLMLQNEISYEGISTKTRY
jgi:hypothetical protein